ncbi:MAG: IS1634 family transposase [Chlamydiota bacterium]
MFIRIKSTPNSPRKSVQICENVRTGNSVKQTVLRHIGVAKDEQHLIELKKLAEYLKAQIKEEKYGPFLFQDEDFASSSSELKPVVVSSTEKEKPTFKEKSTEKPEKMINLNELFEEKRVVEGFHDIFGKLFHELGFDLHLPKKTTEVLRDILLARIANPQSKKASQEMLMADFGRDVELDRIYRMMDLLMEKKEEIEKQIFFATQSLAFEKAIVVFFDVTTLYFESTEQDELRNFGYSKDQQFHTTQVVLALATNKDGLPIGHKLFPGNTAEVKTLLSCLEDWKKILPIGEVFFVADRAMMSETNLSQLEAAGIKYVIAAKLKKLSKNIQEEILTAEGLELNFSGEILKKQEKTLENNRKLIITYSAKRAEKDRKDRDRLLEKMKSKVEKTKNLKNLVSNKGYLKFLKTEGKIQATLNEEKIAEDERWDGFHGIITNDLETNPQELLARYRRLWVIEESFRMHKHNLEIRPIYHFKPERVTAHILLCYMAFTMIRHVEFRVEKQQEKISIEEIRKELWRTQSSLLLDKSTNKKYRLPSKLSVKAKAIYQTFGAVRGSEILEL